MTIATETSKVAYCGNGSTASFAIPFHFVRQDDVRVLLRGADGQEEALTLTTDYTLQDEELGGTLTLAVPPPEGATLVAWRDPAILQETVYVEGVPLSAKARENALDLLTMICQANRERVERAVKFSVASQAGEVVMPDPEAGKVIVWDGAGDNLENGPDASTIAVANASAVSAGAAKDAALAAQTASETAAAAAIAAKDQAEAIAGADAAAVVFDPDGSGLAATNVDEALLELDAAMAAGLAGKSDSGHTHSLTLADITGAGTAAAADTGTSEGDVPVLGSGGVLDPSMLPSSVPLGTIIMVADGVVPQGYLALDQAVSRTAYADLFAVFGTTYGEGDGATTFDLPSTNLLARVTSRNAGLDYDTAVSSGVLSGYEAERAFDGNTSSQWISATTSIDQYVGVTFAEARTVMGFRMKDGIYGNAGQNATKVDLETFDGSSWTAQESIDVTMLNVYQSDSKYVLESPITANGFRLRRTAVGSASNWRVNEIELYEPVGKWCIKY